MRFSVFLPPRAKSGAVPALYYLAGLTCTEETFMIKAGGQRLAAALGLMLVTPDTSPRGSTFPAMRELGFRDRSGVLRRRDAVTMVAALPHVQLRHRGAAGTHPGRICGTSWLAGHLRPFDGRAWRAHLRIAKSAAVSLGLGLCSDRGADALSMGDRRPSTAISVRSGSPGLSTTRASWWAKRRFERPILIDQGSADKFLAEQLYPQVFADSCRQSGTALTLRMQDGYDHGYYFISSFVADHLRHHAAQLGT